MPATPPGRARDALLLFAIVAALGSVQHYRNDVHPANEAVRIYTALAIVDHGTVALDPVFDDVAPGWRQAGSPPNRDVALRDGRYLLDKAPGLSLAAVPVIAALRALGLHPGFADLAWGLSLLLCALPTAAFAVFLARRLRRDPATAGAPGWIPGALVVASPWLAYGGMFFGHAPAAALIGFGAMLGLGAFGARPTGASHVAGDGPGHAFREGLGAGLALGAAVLVELPALALAAAVAVAVAADRSARTRFLGLVAGAAIPAAILMTWNVVNFGNPFAMSYGFKHDAMFATLHAQGLYGVSWPSLERLWGLLVGARRGLLFLAPWLVIGLAGAVAAAFDRGLSRGWRILLAGGGLGFPLLMAGFVDWTAGASMGPRHLLAGLAIPGIAAARLLARTAGTNTERWLQPAAAGAAGTSAALCALGAWVFPYFDSAVANPLFEVSLPVLLEAGFAPTFWNSWLPGIWGALPPILGSLVALGAGWLPRRRVKAQAAPRPTGRDTHPAILAATIALSVAFAHISIASMPHTADARGLRALLATRAAAFEMVGRDDLAKPVREALRQNPPTKSP